MPPIIAMLPLRYSRQMSGLPGAVTRRKMGAMKRAGHACPAAPGPALGLLAWLVGAGAWAATAPATPEDIARQLVGQTLGVPAQAVQVVSSTPREFPDTSLDCPAPDLAYAQVLTPGHVVIVETEGRRFDVRVAGASGRICHRRKGSPSAPPPGPLPAQAAAAAREDLARRLAVDVAEIQVMNLRKLTAGEVVPGCGPVCGPEAGYCGYGIRLLLDGQVFDYVSAGDEVRPCTEIASR